MGRTEFRYARRPPGARTEGHKAPDRRRSDRIADCPPLVVTGVAAAVYDVSRAGVCLLVRSPLHPGDRYDLTLQDTLDETSVAMAAEVVWCRSGRAGLRWLELSPEQDMWLLNHFQTWFRHMDGSSRR